MTPVPEPASRIDEQLSAWLDDELPAAELELLATRLAQAPELRARVARYGLIGTRLRAGRAGRAGGLACDLAALRLGERVQGGIDASMEPASPAMAGRRMGRRMGRWSYGLAAGFALLAVALVPVIRISTDSQPATATAAKSLLVPVAEMPVSPSSNRMTSYLVYHGQYSGMLSAKVTQAKIINHRSNVAGAPLANGAVAR